VTVALDGQAQPSPGGNWPDVAWRAADGSYTALTPDPNGPHDGQLRYLPPAPLYRDGPPTLRSAWPNLNVATIQNGQASLAVHRNEHLIDGITTNPAFVIQPRARSRLMTIRWIWLVPSKICITLVSRMYRSTGKSVV
jgi:hypothetical protein